ncbi:hypothetical protein KEJ27_09865 [Candidatus Bathyarchaeota archaeon]|nr:hypothetical protein [Candidatus Bathyarchaeota archaeon]
MTEKIEVSPTLYIEADEEEWDELEALVKEALKEAEEYLEERVKHGEELILDEYFEEDTIWYTVIPEKTEEVE